MTVLMMMIVSKTIYHTSPIILAISILMLSIMTTALLFKTVMSSWLSFVTILTFSSGMMTLFMYTASLSPNEKMKQKKTLPFFIILMFTMIPSATSNSLLQKETMKMFSNYMTMMIMAVILIITMMSISTHGHHPNQTVSSSF